MLDIETIAFTLLNYPISYLELIATLFGLLSVYLATRVNILTWPAGIVNQVGFFCLFYQVNLYADMLLQCIFFITTLYGWHAWRNQSDEGAIARILPPQFLILLVVLTIVSLLLSFLIADFHQLMPELFPEPATHPLADSLVAVASVFAIVMQAKRIAEAWVLWILLDIVSIGLFISREIYLVALEFVIFLFLAIYGYRNWRGRVVF